MALVPTKSVVTGENRAVRRVNGKRNGKKMGKTDKHIKEVVNQVLTAKANRLSDDLCYNDTNATGQGASTTPTLVLLTSVPQGVTQEARQVDAILLCAIEYCIQVSYNYSASVFAQDLFDWVRFGFVRWLENTLSATPTTTTLWQIAPSTALTTSPFNFETRMNYERLTDQRTLVTGYLNSTASATVPTSNSSQTFDGMIKLNGRRVMYNPAVQTGTGHVYFFYFSDSASTPHPLVNYYIRLIYKRVV